MDYIENIFFLGHHVDDKIKNQFIGITMDLNGLDESKDTHLHINSLSGNIQFVLSNIHITHNMHGIDYFYASLNPKHLILGMSSWA